MTDALRIVNHTAGFYRIDASDPDRLQYAPNFVHMPVAQNGVIVGTRSLSFDGDRGPAEGWTWYNDHTEAMAALDMPIEAVDAALAEHLFTRGHQP